MHGPSRANRKFFRPSDDSGRMDPLKLPDSMKNYKDYVEFYLFRKVMGMNLEVGVLLFSATLRRGTSTLVSGK